jgi:hypothetical protein
MHRSLAVLLPFLLLALAPPLAARTFYVRTDGGSAAQCTGLADAAYPGSGSGRACAWNHPFWALPPGGQAPRIAGGDTLVIGPGSYRMGFGAPNTGDCEAAGAFDCTAAPVPGGPSAAQPTRIVGAGWSSGCAAPPELWGAERPWWVLDLRGASHVLVACLEITDHSGCIENHTGGLACRRDEPPYGDWASVGIYAADASDVTLRNLNIHGLASQGVLAGRLRDWTVEDVRISHNGLAGWDGDVPGDDHNTGTLTFRRWTVEWNGCGETWPGRQTTGCWAQEAGGYGDGVGTGTTAGTWIIEDSRFEFNTSDGLDLLYVEPPGRIEIRRSRAVGNAGNAIKVRGDALIENSLVVGNCGFFAGKPFTYLVDHCRALGSALSLDLNAGSRVTLRNNTVYSEGDCLIGIDDSGCNGTEAVRSRNNIFLGAPDFLQPGDRACLAYNNGCPGDPVDADYNLITGVKNDVCPEGPHDVCADPRLADAAPESFDAALRPGSPALDAGSAADCPPDDLVGARRPQDGDGDGRAACDLGALERPGLPGAACAAGATTLCLQGGRFRVEVSWQDFAGHTGPGQVVPVDSASSGLFWFFSPDNWELMVKVLNGCAFNNRYWVFSAATTSVAYTLTVEDTRTGARREYRNRSGVPSPAITDTAAFATCP